MRAFVCLVIVSCLLGSEPVLAAGLEIGGYYENDLLGVLKRNGDIAGGNVNRLRLKIDSKLHPRLALHIEPRYYVLLKSENLTLPGVSSVDQLVIDRAYAKAYFPGLSLTVGKQRIAWGTGYIWNPTDVFNPFVLSFAVREEEKINVEAVRLEIPLGDAGGIDGYLAGGNEWNNTRKGVRAKTNIGRFDLSLSYVDLGNSGYQLGFDSAGEVGVVGVRNEIVFKNLASGSSYIQGGLGWDYTLENGLGLNMEYFHNGLGNRHTDYLYFGLNKTLDELTQISGSLLMNLNDLSFILYPSYRRNIMQNVDLSLDAMLVGGEEGSEYYPAPAQDPAGLAGSKIVLIRLICNF